MRQFSFFVWSAVLLMHISMPAGMATVLPSGSPSYHNQLWRMTGRLVARDARAFSYSIMFFRYTEPHGVVLCAASLSILDESRRRFSSERRTERVGFGLADAKTASIYVGTWRLSKSPVTGAPSTFNLDAKLDGVALLLRSVSRKPHFVLRSATTEYDGYSSVASNGTLMIDGRRLEVVGKSWLDHEMSNIAPSVTVPAAQFRVQLDDGREILVEECARAEMCVARRRAYLIERDGTVVILQRGSYEFGGHPGSTWYSPHTGTIYPDIWALHVDDKTQFLSLEPVSVDQESLANGNGLSYWDGAVDIYDVTPGSQGLRLGSGYVLMTGYTPQARNR